MVQFFEDSHAEIQEAQSHTYQLYAAVMAGQLEEAAVWLSESADLMAQFGTYGESLLAIAVRSLGFGEVSWLLNQGASVNSVDYRGRTPLMSALFHGERGSKEVLDVVRLLLEFGADVNQRDQLGRTALFYATSVELTDKTSPEIVAELLKVGGESKIMTEE